MTPFGLAFLTEHSVVFQCNAAPTTQQSFFLKERASQGEMLDSTPGLRWGFAGVRLGWFSKR